MPGRFTPQSRNGDVPRLHVHINVLTCNGDTPLPPIPEAESIEEHHLCGPESLDSEYDSYESSTDRAASGRADNGSPRAFTTRRHKEVKPEYRLCHFRLVRSSLADQAVVCVRDLVINNIFCHHLLGMVRHNPSPEELMTVEIPTRIRQNSTVFENKYNTAEEVVLNYQYTRVFARICKSDPSGCLREALTSAKRSLIKGAGATQNYQPNTLSDGLPWTNLSASLFSGTSYLVLVAAGSLALAVRERSQICRLRGRGLRQILPLLVLYGLIAFTLLFGSLRFTEVTEMGAPFGWYDGFTWTESNRLKFLFEIISLPIGVSGVCVGMLLVAKAASAKIQTRLR